MICSSWHSGHLTRSKKDRKNYSSDRVTAQKSRVLKRISRKDSALVRHLAWLRELEKNKERLTEEKRLEKERQLKRKRLLKENRHKNEKKLLFLANENITFDQSSPLEANLTSLKNDRPAWCQTGEAQNATENQVKADDENAILDFIDQLNFDEYNEDLELQALIIQVKNRIVSLQKERKWDEKMLQACTDVSAMIVFIR